MEAAKWLALLLMTGDHVNAALFGRELPVLTEVGRVVLPIFALLLGANMGRPGDTGARYARTLKRLVLFAALSTVPYAMAFGHVLPLNILWTFAVAVGVAWLYDRDHLAASTLLFVVGGVFVDYHWGGLGLVMAGRFWWRDRAAAICYGAASLAFVCLLNGSLWAVAGVPLLALATALPERLPRLRWAFYGYYPAHLAVLAALGVVGA